MEEILMEALAEVDLAPFFAKKGQWGVHPIRVCAILLLQAMEGLTDRQVEQAINVNIGWKYVLHMGLTDDAWHPSILAEHRERFCNEEALAVFLDSVLIRAKENGLLDTRMQRMDSTFVVANVKALHQTELILESVRNAIEEITETDWKWMSQNRQAHWLQTYYLDRPFNYKIPKDESKRVKMAESSAKDGYYILEQIDKTEAPKKRILEELESVRILRKILEQQTKIDGKGKQQKIRLRAEKEMPPARERLVSPHETDARFASKGNKSVIGYKTHSVETCTPGFPSLITHIQTEAATVNDSLSVEGIVRSVKKRGFLPKRLWLDGGYVNVDLFAQFKKSLGIDFVARLVNGHSWQSKEGKGFDQASFEIDWRKKIAICPAGIKSSTWKEDSSYGPNVYFPKEKCASCRFKKNCTKNDYRILHLKSKPVYRYMSKMREKQQTEEFQKEYSIRAGVEALQSQLIKVHGRRTTMRTKPKVSLKMILAAAAVNVSRLIDWKNKGQKRTSRKSHYEMAFAIA